MLKNCVGGILFVLECAFLHEMPLDDLGIGAKTGVDGHQSLLWNSLPLLLRIEPLEDILFPKVLSAKKNEYQLKTILLTLGLQIAQSRPYLHTLGPKVGIICLHGALG